MILMEMCGYAIHFEATVMTSQLLYVKIIFLLPFPLGLCKVLNIGCGRIAVLSLLLISRQIADKCSRCGQNCCHVAVKNS